jgi:hypothetical protein
LRNQLGKNLKFFEGDSHLCFKNSNKDKIGTQNSMWLVGYETN